MSLESITEGYKPGNEPMPVSWGLDFPEWNNAYDPCLDLCIIARAIPKESSVGGIIIPDVAKSKAAFLNEIGKIVAVGPLWYEKARMKELKDEGSFYVPKVGDVVKHDPGVGSRLQFQGIDGEFLELQDQMIKGIFRDLSCVAKIKYYA